MERQLFHASFVLVGAVMAYLGVWLGTFGDEDPQTMWGLVLVGGMFIATGVLLDKWLPTEERLPNSRPVSWDLLAFLALWLCIDAVRMLTRIAAADERAHLQQVTTFHLATATTGLLAFLLLRHRPVGGPCRPTVFSRRDLVNSLIGLTGVALFGVGVSGTVVGMLHFGTTGHEHPCMVIVPMFFPGCLGIVFFGARSPLAQWTSHVPMGRPTRRDAWQTAIALLGIWTAVRGLGVATLDNFAPYSVHPPEVSLGSVALGVLLAAGARWIGPWFAAGAEEGRCA